MSAFGNNLYFTYEFSHPSNWCIFFSGDINEDQKLVDVNDSNRDDLIDVIDSLKIDGGTCLYDGLMQGMTVSKQTNQEFLFFEFVKYS